MFNLLQKRNQPTERWVNPTDAKHRAQLLSQAFASYDDAIEACGDMRLDKEAIAIIYARQKAFFIDAENFPSVPWYLTAGIAAAIPRAYLAVNSPLRVLDFGGSVGIHLAMAKHQSPRIPIEKWAVVETASYVELAKELETETLKFFSDIDAAISWLEDIDLVTSSGAVQCTHDPVYFLARLLATNAPVVALQRCALSAGETFTTVQLSMLSGNAYGPLPDGFQDLDVRSPNTYIGKRLFFDMISESHRIGIQILNDAGQQLIAGHGIFDSECYILDRIRP